MSSMLPASREWIQGKPGQHCEMLLYVVTIDETGTGLAIIPNWEEVT
jgi:hypothetical protein